MGRKKERQKNLTVEKLQHQGRKVARSGAQRKEAGSPFSGAFLWCFITRLARCGQGEW